MITDQLSMLPAFVGCVQFSLPASARLIGAVAAPNPNEVSIIVLTPLDEGDKYDQWVPRTIHVAYICDMVRHEEGTQLVTVALVEGFGCNLVVFEEVKSGDLELV